MTHADHDDLALFEQADLLPALVMPNNLLPMQEAAFQHGAGGLALTMAQAWSEERRDRSWGDVHQDGPTYRWTTTVCGPTPDTSEACRPYVLSVDLRCDHNGTACHCVGELIYRHLCTCGHADPARIDENSAAEDAMDHTWTGWRDLPILASSMPDETKQKTRWLKSATEAYPTGWLEAGGPVRTARGVMGLRHVPRRTPYGGYDLGVVVTEQHLNHVYKPGLYETDLIGLLATG